MSREIRFFRDENDDEQGVEIGEDGAGFFVRTYSEGEEYTHRLHGPDADRFADALATMAIRHHGALTEVRLSARMATALAFIADRAHVIDCDADEHKENGTTPAAVESALEWIAAHARRARQTTGRRLRPIKVQVAPAEQPEIPK